MTRKAPTLKIKLAAALLQIRDHDGQPLIEWEHSKLMHTEQILMLFEWDHYPIRHEAGGPSEPWNLVPRFTPAHRIKTSKIDIPEIAKIRHVTEKQQAFRDRMLAKDRGEEKPKSRWPKRKMGTSR